MDKCGICNTSTEHLFETGKEGVYACFKCQPLVPEITFDDNEDGNTEVVEEETNGSNLNCLLCGKGFQKLAQLQNHVRNHRAEKRFVCTYCNKAFTQSNNLRAHLRIHTNERPYKCSQCEKAFTQVTNLNNHMRLHTGERPFVCPEPGCNKAYAQVTNLNHHRKRHEAGNADMTYVCSVCGEQFEHRHHMYLHKREAHTTLRVTRATCVQDRASQPVTKETTPSANGNCTEEDRDSEHAEAKDPTDCLVKKQRASSSPAPTQPFRPRGRPRKAVKAENAEYSEEESYYNKVKILKQDLQCLPKSKNQEISIDR